ncbi:MAG: DsbA family protein [Alphaproteobacteria bacterium]|nr:DsbA family protein [Alphaproteobacteria bacterium]
MKKSLLFATIAAVGIMASSNPATAFTDAEETELNSIIKNYISNNPDVIIDSLNQSRMKEMAAARKKAQKDIKKYKTELHADLSDPVIGNPNGDITLIEFFDYNCGYCKSVLPSIKKLIEQDKNIRIVFKEKPSLGATSFFATKAAIASIKQGKYFKFHQALMGAKGRLSEAKVMKIAQDIGLDTEKLSKDLNDPSVNKMIEKNQKLASKLGMRGVPAIIIEDQYFPGAMPLDAMVKEIKKIRDARAK